MTTSKTADSFTVWACTSCTTAITAWFMHLAASTWHRMLVEGSFCWKVLPSCCMMLMVSGSLSRATACIHAPPPLPQTITQLSPTSPSNLLAFAVLNSLLLPHPLYPIPLLAWGSVQAEASPHVEAGPVLLAASSASESRKSGSLSGGWMEACHGAHACAHMGTTH